jgi:hypothetical protein
MNDVNAISIAKPRVTDVVSDLTGFAITTFTVPLAKLASMLPRALEPTALTLDSGVRVGMVSAVTFLNTEFRVGFAPFIRLVAAQTNYRAYVRRGDEDAVWFFGTMLASPFVVLPRYAWALPWAYGRVTRAMAFDVDGHCTDYAHHAICEHGEEHLEAVGTRVPMGRLDGFADARESARVLTHPLVGYVARTRGGHVTYGVDHEALALERADATVARYTFFERLGLVAPDQEAHSVLVMPSTHFVVRLPPARVDLG